MLFRSVTVIGSFDGRNFHREQVQNMDYGLDFYAPQTMLAPDGRRILVGWMQNWATSTFVPAGAKYYGQLTLPRELSLKNGRLCQWPIRELEACREKAGDAWDDEEYYVVFDAVRADFPGAAFEKLSPCAGLLTLGGDASLSPFPPPAEKNHT